MGTANVVLFISLMSLIGVARFYCLVIIEFAMLCCNNVSQVFLFSFMHACWMVSDWHLVPIHDWLVSLPLMWFFTNYFSAVCPFVFAGFIFTPSFVRARSLHALMALFFCCVLLCFLFCCQYCTSERLCVLALVIWIYFGTLLLCLNVLQH